MRGVGHAVAAVTPAEAGSISFRGAESTGCWIPAFAGMTETTVPSNTTADRHEHHD